MNRDFPEKHDPSGPPGADGPEGEELDPRLPSLLAQHQVPAPKEDFVDDTLLRIQAQAWKLPEPSMDFVQRVTDAIAADRRRPALVTIKEPGAINARGEEDVPTHQHPQIRSIDSGQQQGKRVTRSLLRFLLPAALTAAAVILAFLLPFGENADNDMPSVAQLQDPWLFAEQGSNTVGRMISLVGHEFRETDTDNAANIPLRIIPALHVPAAPGPGIAALAVQGEQPFELDASLIEDGN